MTITPTSKGYQVRFAYDPETVEYIKGFNKHKHICSWRQDLGCWLIPAYAEYIIDALCKKYNVVMKGNGMPEQVGKIDPLPELTVPLPEGIEQPFEFQKNGVARGMELKRFMNCDAPGLGKSYQAIVTSLMLECKCILIICPNTLKYNWQNEWMKVAGKRSMIISDRTRVSWTTYYEAKVINVFICNYESLKGIFLPANWTIPKKNGRKVAFRVRDIPFKDCAKLPDCIIVDESHKVKSEDTLTSKIVMGLCREKPVRMLLTGTPIVNKPYDLFTQLTMINRLKDIVAHIKEPTDVQGNGTDPIGQRRFIDRYCDGKIGGASYLKELNHRLNSICFFRREKKDVLKDLPDKMRKIILCELTNQKEYDEYEQGFIDVLEQAKREENSKRKAELKAAIFTKTQVLAKIAAMGKIEAAQEYIDEINLNDQKIVVFIHNKDVYAALKEVYPDALSVVGDDSTEARDKAVDEFQHKPSRDKIFCSIMVAGVGLTLTAAWEVLFIQLPYTDAALEQGSDRVHRIGQTMPVGIGILLAKDTIDEYIYYDIIMKKRLIANQVTGDKFEVTDQVIDGMLSFFGRKKKNVEV